MATIKSTSQALGNLINTINGALQQPSLNVTSFPSSFSTPLNNIGIDDDSIPSNMLDMLPEFEMNYRATKKQCIKKAKALLEKIVKEVVPSLLLNSAMILDKISQDAELLGCLYYEYEKTDLISLSIMNTIARGETLARLFEVYTRTSKMLQELSGLVTDTQNLMRKYYIDTYLDLQLKDDSELQMISSSNKETLAIEENPDNQNIIVGTENLTKLLAEKKKKALIAKYEEAKTIEESEQDNIK